MTGVQTCALPISHRGLHDNWHDPDHRFETKKEGPGDRRPVTDRSAVNGFLLLYR